MTGFWDRFRQSWWISALGLALIGFAMACQLYGDARWRQDDAPTAVGSK